MRRLRSLSARMTINHILVATLTGVIGILFLALLIVMTLRNLQAVDYIGYAGVVGIDWLFGLPDAQPNPPNANIPAGFSMMVSQDNVILHTQGDAPCRTGNRLADCAPELIDLPTGERFFQKNGETWVEVVEKTILGQRAIVWRGPQPSETCFILGSYRECNTAKFVLVAAGIMGILSLPVALLLGWFSARPLARRMSAIAKVSQRFAQGDLQARVGDPHQDEIGALAHQFDDMAETLQHNLSILRDLAQRNADLARQAEQSAIQAERARLSRDLHDAIAQRLFSLSVSTATLPDLISQNQAQGVEQARTIATLAEQTLLDLRTLLVELRPSMVVQKGLSEALEAACGEWQTVHHIPIDCSIMLTGKWLPAGIEDTVFRITQEALSNIAKHAHATTAQVSLVEGRRQIILSVTDNGAGFDLIGASGSGKFGLMSMRERARTLGGNLTIESDTSQGTTVRLTLPLEREITS